MILKLGDMLLADGGNQNDHTSGKARQQCRRPELVRGLLCRGDKLCVQGPRQAGKTAAMLNLACAIATGGEWFGHPCQLGRVLYVNFELCDGGWQQRIEAVAKVGGYERGLLKANLETLNLRGRMEALSTLAPKLCEWAVGRHFDCVILDPTYGLHGNAASMASAHEFSQALEQIADELTAAVVYTRDRMAVWNERWKMIQGTENTAFVTDADATLTIAARAQAEPVYRLAFKLRHFPQPEPIDVRFAYPGHEPWDDAQ